ncbi:MAG: cell surface protein SprA, partial [Bacteroidia bacterium]
MSKHSIGVLVSAMLTFFFGGNLEEVQPENQNQGNAQVTEVTLMPGVEEALVDTPRNPNPNDRVIDPTRAQHVSPLWKLDPANQELKFELTEDGSGYYIYEKIGNVWLRRPSFISFEDYLELKRKQGLNAYYREKGFENKEKEQKEFVIRLLDDVPDLQDIFGGGAIEIRPTGFANISLSYDVNNSANPALPQRAQKQGLINFDQQIQLGTTGQIGNLMDLNFNFDNKATFDFENLVRLKYDGKEDAILQGIEAGNVSMPLGNTLIQGRQNLFGLKLRWKLGPVDITTIGSIEQGQVESVTFGGGSGSSGGVETPFTKEIAEYDEYRHYFLGHYFRSRYDDALENLPVINSTVRINRVEVWINNVRSATTQNNRNAIGFVDLGENELAAPRGGNGVVLNDLLITPNQTTRLPDNDANSLYGQLSNDPSIREYRSAPRTLKNLGYQNGIDFEVVTNMRKLQPNEYRFDPALGYVSLNQKMIANQVLFVAFEYTLNGEVFKVGEFSQDIPTNPEGTNALFLKMLKPASVKPTYQAASGSVEQYPAWDLMMKNIYNIGYGLQSAGFFLEIFYNSGTSAGKLNFLPDGPLARKPLIQVAGVDNLTNNTGAGPDN